ncbi:MAG: cytochrome c biogenesis protein ResB [Deltaproteobacteria bacterium]|nr:cytochrome c biogenesis protein ResB [Deltaproteobacteria bacterium]
MTEKRSNITWDILSSVRLTLVLLIILAVTSIFGTIIPQQEGAIEFARRLSPGLFRLFGTLQLFDMYHALWFRVIIGCLSLNLIVCSINRFPATLKRFRILPRPDRSKPFDNLPSDRSFTVKGEIREIAGQVSGLINGRYRNMAEKEVDKGMFFYGDQGRSTLFGVYLVHLSVLLILTGAITGSLFGFKAYVNLPEGETVDTVAIRSSEGHSHKGLGFSVRCEKFFVDFYDNGSPKEYRSELSFLIDDNEVKKGNLRVNHPITFRGITFYQSSYGSTPGNNVRLSISKDFTGQNAKTLEVEKGQIVQLNEDGVNFQVMEVDANLRGMMGPAALISIRSNQEEETRFWVFQDLATLKERFPEAMLRSPMLNPSAFEPYTFYLDEIKVKRYTGLQVSRDPGVPFVWAGFILIMIGLFITFFMSYRRVWIRVTRDKQEIRISVAGTANKNPVGMERELDHLTQRLYNLLTAERKA